MRRENCRVGLLKRAVEFVSTVLELGVNDAVTAKRARRYTGRALGLDRRYAEAQWCREIVLDGACNRVNNSPVADNLNFDSLEDVQG